MLDEKTLKEITEFSKAAGGLKRLERSGWKSHAQIKEPESVADHTFRAVLISMLIGDLKKLDTEKLMRMALLHDIHETIMGDWDRFKKEKLGMKKHDEEEKKAIKKIIEILPEELKEKYAAIWKEMLECKTEEAKLFRGIDRLELTLQALEYGEEGYRKALDLMWRRSKERFEKEFDDEDLKKIFDMLDKERERKG